MAFGSRMVQPFQVVYEPRQLSTRNSVSCGTASVGQLLRDGYAPPQAETGFNQPLWPSHKPRNHIPALWSAASKSVPTYQESACPRRRSIQQFLLVRGTCSKHLWQPCARKRPPGHCTLPGGRDQMLRKTVHF
jgi:hypothetical protein